MLVPPGEGGKGRIEGEGGVGAAQRDKESGRLVERRRGGFWREKRMENASTIEMDVGAVLCVYLVKLRWMK